jgi:hypothetical protein
MDRLQRRTVRHQAEVDCRQALKLGEHGASRLDESRRRSNGSLHYAPEFIGLAADDVAEAAGMDTAEVLDIFGRF